MRRFLPTLTLLAALLLPTLAVAAPPTSPGYETLNAGTLRFHYRSKDAGVAAALALKGPEALETIADKTGVSSPRVIDVVLSPTFAEFAAAQPGTPPSWAAGTAYHERGEVYLVEIKSQLRDESVDQLLEHLWRFPRFFPDHHGKKLFGILAALDIPENLRARALKEGFYLATIKDDGFEIVPPDDGFEPRAFGLRGLG